MTKNFISTNNISLEEIYYAILAKEKNYAAELYAQLEGMSLDSAKKTMSVIYRIFHLGYEDCLQNMSADDLPKFDNKSYAAFWTAGFNFALRLPTFKLNQ